MHCLCTEQRLPIGENSLTPAASANAVLGDRHQDLFKRQLLSASFNSFHFRKPIEITENGSNYSKLGATYPFT